MTALTKTIVRYFEWNDDGSGEDTVVNVYILTEFNKWKPMKMENLGDGRWHIEYKFDKIEDFGIFMYKYIVVRKKKKSIVPEETIVEYICDNKTCIPICFDDQGNKNNIVEIMDMSLHPLNKFQFYISTKGIYKSSVQIECNGCNMTVDKNIYHCKGCNKYDYCQSCYNDKYLCNGKIFLSKAMMSEYIVATHCIRAIEQNPPMKYWDALPIISDIIDKCINILKNNDSDLYKYLHNTYELLSTYTNSKKIYSAYIQLCRKIVKRVYGDIDWFDIKNTFIVKS